MGNDIYQYISSLIHSHDRPRLDIHNFKEVRLVSDEMDHPNNFFSRHKNKKGGIRLEYFDNGQRIGYIRYYITTGQVGLFFIEDEYRNRGL